jgi:hypothetical protein
VSRANDVINNISATPGMSDDTKSRRIAECKFLRAFAYYQLNCLWRGVPYYDVNVSPGEYTKPRESESQIWEYIISDLTDCINCEQLPDKYAASSSDFGRITKGAAYALRGKVYMWLKDWAAAERDLTQVGKLGYELYSGSYADLFTVANEKCNEMVFSIPMIEVADNGNVWSYTYGNRVTAGYGDNAYFLNTHFVDSFQWANGKPFDWDDIIDGYDAMDPKARSVYFLRDNMTDQESTNMSTYGADLTKYLSTGNEARIKKAYENRDPRLAAIAITPYSEYLGGSTGSALTYTARYPYRGSTSPNFDITTTETSDFLYCIRKFVTKGREYTNIRYNPLDVPVIRYAGVLLDLAEAVNEQGRTTEAVALVNQVRQRAGVALLNQAGNNYVQVSGIEDMRKRIQDEHRWELACEQVVYYDELRWGTWKEEKFDNAVGLQQVWGSTVVPYVWNGDGHDVWAVPSSEIERNRNLTQNTGWY